MAILFVPAVFVQSVGTDQHILGLRQCPMFSRFSIVQQLNILPVVTWPIDRASREA